MKLITGHPPTPFTTTSQTGDSLRSNVFAIYPMTRAQEGLWTAYRASPHHTLYNLTLCFSLPTKSAENKGYSLETIYQGIKILTQRHGILRSTFHENTIIHPRPFVAEDDPLSVTPVIETIVHSVTATDQVAINSVLHRAVDLSAQYAARWVVVISATGTVIYLIAHHIALDGLSMSILASEFFAIIDEERRKECDAVVSSPQVGVALVTQPFSQAHLLERAYMASDVFQASESFWLSQLVDVNPFKWRGLPTLTTSRNYREIQTWGTFSKKDLSSWGNCYKTSWFRVVVSLIGLLGRSYSLPDHGSDNAVIVAFGGRPPSLGGAVGQFANAMPIRIPFSMCVESGLRASKGAAAAMPFERLVQAVSKQMSAAKKHDRFSFADLARARNKRGLEMLPPQVAITLSPQLARPECELYPVEGPYDLFFCFLEGPDSIELGVVYNPTLFSSSTLSTMKRDFESLRVMSEKEVPLDMFVLPALQLHRPRLLPAVDLSSSEAISASRFHRWFEGQTAAIPEQMALQCAEKDEFMSYGALNDEANRISHYLRKEGAGRGTLVLLHLRRGFGLMQWIIGVLKSGAAFAVADQTHPVERNRSAIAVALPVLLVDDGHGVNATKLVEDLPVRALRTTDMRLGAMPTTNPIDDSRADDLAYVVFTSGSTGQPKAVEIEHQNLAHFVANAFASRYTSIGQGTRVLQFATFAFDAAQLEWSQCLALGGTLCFAETPQALVGDYLADTIENNQVTFMHITPSVLATMPTCRPLPSLRQISVGGEMVPASLIDQWRSRVLVHNAYGPSECTIVMAHQPQPRGRHEEQPPANIIGLPHQNARFYICDEAFERVLSPGEVGEVCIGGPQVGRGYKGRDDLTQLRFAVHPKLNERLYRTGDKGRLEPDGSVFLIGRLDREIKLRGYRIDLDDIERTISGSVDGVQGVSVQVAPDVTSLCAFVAPQSIDGELVRTRVAERLPRYMIPAKIYCLEKLPLNTSDKVDHKLIKSLLGNFINEAERKAETFATADTQRPSVIHRTVSQVSSISKISTPSSNSTVSTRVEAFSSTIEKIWNDVLNISGPRQETDDFFNLGGDSLKIQLLAQKLRKEYNVNVRVVDLFTRVTIAAQAGLLREAGVSSISSPQTVPRSPLPGKADQHILEKAADPMPIDTEHAQRRIQALWKKILGARPSHPDVDFFEMGGTSVTVPRLLQGIHQEWPVANVKIIDLFRHRTVKAQAALVLAFVAASQVAAHASFHQEVIPGAVSDVHTCDIAIIGISGRFPGAPTPDDLYCLFSDKREALTDLPGRSTPLPFDDAIYVPKRGRLNGLEEFRPKFWNLSDDEARNMDPQQRLFMETTLEALEDSGHIPAPEGRNNIGLCVGAARDTWQHATETVYGDNFYRVHRADLTPSISARTAYHLNLHGPNITLNTACSSGLVALATAVGHLRSQQCDLSVAGGVSISFPQEGYITAAGQIFSPSGQCRPFDSRADGTVPADGVGAVVLCRLEDAIQRGDKIYSVISGIAIGSDGATDKVGITMPSSRGHAEVMKRAWADASHPSPAKTVYVELHGSGTAIGDALEMEALNIAKSELGYAGTWTVGSNKGNLGNCEAASGIASLIKMCKSVQHGLVPPLQSFEELNPMIDSRLPFTIAREATPISAGDILCISSLGLGGVNAHCVMRFPPHEFLRPIEKPAARPRYQKFTAPLKTSVVLKPEFDMAGVIAMCASHVLSVPVQPDTDLRAAGMDSIGQIRLLRKLREVFSSNSFRISMFSNEDCTPTALADVISSAPGSSIKQSAVLANSCTLLHSGSEEFAFILVAPAGGSCASYISLAQTLSTGSDASVLALEHPNFFNPGSETFSVKELGERYAHDLQLVFPRMRSAVLIGASFGGIVACELATKLPGLGIMLKSIALLDSPWPRAETTVCGDAFSAKYFIRDIFGVDAPVGHYPRGKDPLPLSLTVQLESMLLNLDESNRARIESHDWRRLLTVYVENVLALNTYSVVGPPPPDCTVLYVRAIKSAFTEEAKHWEAYAATLETMDVDATHAEVCAAGQGVDIARRLIDLIH